MKNLLLLAAAVVLAAPVAQAAQGGGKIAGYITNSAIDIEGGGDDDGMGFGIKGMVMLNGPVFLHGEYQTTELDDSGADLNSLRLGGGYAAPLTPQSKLFGKVEYIDFGSDIDQAGLGAHVGAMFDLSPMLSLMGSIGYISTDDTDGFEMDVGGHLAFTKQVGAFADYRLYSGTIDAPGDPDFEVTDLRIGVTFSFGAM